MNKIELSIVQVGIISMFILAVIIVVIPTSGAADKDYLEPLILYVAPVLGVSIIIGTIVCIRDVFLRFEPGERGGWVLLLLVANLIAYPYYYKNYAVKPRKYNEE